MVFKFWCSMDDDDVKLLCDRMSRRLVEKRDDVQTSQNKNKKLNVIYHLLANISIWTC